MCLQQRNHKGEKQYISKRHSSTLRSIRDLMQFLQLEKVRFALKGFIDVFYKTWQPFFTHVVNCTFDTLSVSLDVSITEMCSKTDYTYIDIHVSVASSQSW